VRALILFTVLAAAAIAVALFARVNAGYVLFVAPPYRVEFSLNAFVLLVLAAFALGYAVLRLAARIGQLPREVREHRKLAQRERVRSRQDAALVALLEGRYGKARQFADEALAVPGSSGLAALVGARAALDTRDFAGAAGYLARPDAQAASLAVPRLMLEAEAALEQGQAGEALDKLAGLKREAGAHTAALRLELRALNQARRPAQIPPVVAELVKRKVYDAAQGEIVRASAQAEALRGLAHDTGGLRDYWNRLSEADRLHPKTARAGAASFLALGGDREAAEIIERSIEREWSADLAVLYAECRTQDATRQLESAERWLAAHSQDATLLFALGRLCERSQLWGKAQTYYEASIALDDDWRTRVAFGEMQARLGRTEAANAQLAAALKLALKELGPR
jgi:HemY protein